MKPNADTLVPSGWEERKFPLALVVPSFPQWPGRGVGFTTVASTPLIGGYGRILRDERAMSTRLRRCLYRLRGPCAPNLTRILACHLERVGAIVDLFSSGQGETPCPAVPIPADPSKLRLSLIEQFEMVTDLAKQHRRLGRDIDTLSELMMGSSADGMLLREASQRHEDMAWMLTESLHEDHPIAAAARPAEPAVSVSGALERKVAPLGKTEKGNG